MCAFSNFNPRGLRRPRRGTFAYNMINIIDFNPRGLRRPRLRFLTGQLGHTDFNPRGLRRPRLFDTGVTVNVPTFISIHEVFADLDGVLYVKGFWGLSISIHEVFADLDTNVEYINNETSISIHEVFADLDPTLIFETLHR